ncbi:MAG TPA: hypothetical protein VMQ54_01890, partial [Steroidobacteraceae bacterium]|nr:hypothetical protein [Steroidobacteraceae bacterium]
RGMQDHGMGLGGRLGLGRGLSPCGRHMTRQGRSRRRSRRQQRRPAARGLQGGAHHVVRLI